MAVSPNSASVKKFGSTQFSFCTKILTFIKFGGPMIIASEMSPYSADSQLLFILSRSCVNSEGSDESFRASPYLRHATSEARTPKIKLQTAKNIPHSQVCGLWRVIRGPGTTAPDLGAELGWLLIGDSQSSRPLPSFRNQSGKCAGA